MGQRVCCIGPKAKGQYRRQRIVTGPIQNYLINDNLISLLKSCRNMKMQRYICVKADNSTLLVLLVEFHLYWLILSLI